MHTSRCCLSVCNFWNLLLSDVSCKLPCVTLTLTTLCECVNLFGCLCLPVSRTALTNLLRSKKLCSGYLSAPGLGPFSGHNRNVGSLALSQHASRRKGVHTGNGPAPQPLQPLISLIYLAKNVILLNPPHHVHQAPQPHSWREFQAEDEDDRGAESARRAMPLHRFDSGGWHIS